MIISIEPQRILHDSCCYNHQINEYVSPHCFEVIAKDSISFRIKVIVDYVEEIRLYCRNCTKELVSKL